MKHSKTVIVLAFGLLSGTAAYSGKTLLGYVLLGIALLVAFNAFTVKKGEEDV